MSEWITDRPPTAADANSTGNILVSVGDSVPEISWDAWTAGQPWTHAPDPYVPETNRRSWFLTAENCYAIEYFDADPNFDTLMAEIDKVVTDDAAWILAVKNARNTPHSQPKENK